MGQVIAMGGGGFSEDDPVLDDYVLEVAGKSRSRVGFLATASGDTAGYIERFYEAFAGRSVASHLRLFPQPSQDPAGWVRDLDVVYVGGGSTANLLAVWGVHGLDRLLREAYDRGAVLAGVSAGGMCWFEAGVTDSFGPYRALRDGLGIVAGSFTPHYDRDDSRRQVLLEALADGLPAGVATDDGAAVHYMDGQFTTVVASRESANAYQVSLRSDGSTLEEPLPRRVLSSG